MVGECVRAEASRVIRRHPLFHTDPAEKVMQVKAEHELACKTFNIVGDSANAMNECTRMQVEEKSDEM